MEMRKRTWGIALILILLLVGCERSTTEKWQEQYDLGQKYLMEENYEEAIVAFNKAIELDTKEIQAYTGLAQAYEAMGDIEKLLGVLNRLIEIEPDNETYRESAQKYENQLQEEVKYGSFREENSEILGQLSEVCSQEDNKRVAALMRSEEFQTMKESFPEDTDRVYGQLISGKRVGIFCVQQDGDAEYYVYYGHVQNGMREEEGSWYYTNAIGFFNYSGSWSNDLPNGEGACYQILSMEDGTWTTEWSTQGIYADGKENGDMTKTVTGDWGAETFSYSCVNGIPPALETSEWGGVVIAYGESNSSNELWLEAEDQAQGVEPFAVHSCAYSIAD